MKPFGSVNASKTRERLRHALQDVGVPRFNQEHQLMLGYLLSFHELVERLSHGKPTPADWREVESLLDQIGRYVQVHFQEEEAWMQQVGYPELPVHKKEHDHFLSQFTGFCQRLAERDIYTTVNMKFFLLDWFFHHINRTDVRYKDYYREGTAA